MGPLYIKAKHKDAKRYNRMGRGIGGFDMIVTNDIFCVFYPEEDIEKVKELVEEFRSLNPDYRFKLARRKKERNEELDGNATPCDTEEQER